jgi:hypothetical protein
MEFGRSAAGDDESGDTVNTDTRDAGETDPGDSGRTDPGDSGRTDAGDTGDANERGYSSGQRAGGRPTGGGSADSDDEDDGGERDVTLSRLENTNVMRLLQNREFPVERDDFVTVASSAYEVSPRHCEKVIDLAVKHDLLREEDGQLHAGPEWA